MESTHDSELFKVEKGGAMTEQVKDEQARRGELLGKMGKEGDPGISGLTLQMHGI